MIHNGKPPMTRAEHLQWAKTRALEYAELGDLSSAFASLASDLNKHPDLREHVGMVLGTALLMGAHLQTQQQMRDFIEGFN